MKFLINLIYIILLARIWTSPFCAKAHIRSVLLDIFESWSNCLDNEFKLQIYSSKVLIVVRSGVQVTWTRWLKVLTSQSWCSLRNSTTIPLTSNTNYYPLPKPCWKCFWFNDTIKTTDLGSAYSKGDLKSTKRRFKPLKIKTKFNSHRTKQLYEHSHTYRYIQLTSL